VGFSVNNDRMSRERVIEPTPVGEQSEAWKNGTGELNAVASVQDG
jgi:hypothetical protein